MNTSGESKTSMSRKQALHHLETSIDVSEDLLVLGRLVSAHAYHSARSSRLSRKLMSGKECFSHLSLLTGIPPQQLNAGMTAWTQHYEAAHTLGLPHSESRPSFFEAWQRMGVGFPFYEQYMISAGRAKELVTDSELARIMGTNLRDPDSLHEYRKVQRLAKSASDLPAQTMPMEIPQAKQDSKERLKRLEQLVQDLNAPPAVQVHPVQPDQAETPPTSDASIQTDTPQAEHGHDNPEVKARAEKGKAGFTDHDKRRLDFVVGLILLVAFFVYDPNEIAGSSGLGRHLRILPTMATLLECFYAVLEAQGFEEAGMLPLLILFIMFKRLEQRLDLQRA
ncbi:MAG: hypothetical protein Q9225_003773 [Loekoesia sp. 1 TL-2023]